MAHIMGWAIDSRTGGPTVGTFLCAGRQSLWLGHVRGRPDVARVTGRPQGRRAGFAARIAVSDMPDAATAPLNVYFLFADGWVRQLHGEFSLQ